MDKFKGTKEEVLRHIDKELGRPDRTLARGGQPEMPPFLKEDTSQNFRKDTVPNTRGRLIEGDSAYRKQYPLASGLLDYFPDALAEASHVSWLGNEKHNPGEPMHHARGKSMDHADCIMRHLTERGGFDTIVVNGVHHRVRHSAALLWRAAALCQEEIEKEMGLPLPRGAKA